MFKTIIDVAQEENLYRKKALTEDDLNHILEIVDRNNDREYSERLAGIAEEMGKRTLPVTRACLWLEKLEAEKRAVDAYNAIIMEELDV